MTDLLAAAPRVYLLALLPAVLWGLEPVVSKRGMARGGTTLQAAVVVVAVDAALYWAVLLGRHGTAALAVFDPRTLGVFALAGVVGTALGRLAVFASIRRVGASITAAGNGVRPVVATLLAAGFLAEPVGPSTLLGVACLAAGLVVFATSRGGDRAGWTVRDLLFPVAAATCFAVGNALRRVGLAGDTSVVAAVAVNESTALVVLLGYVVARGRSGALLGDGRSDAASADGALDAAGVADRRALPFFVVSGLLTALALLSLFTALSLPEGRLVVVEPLASLAPLFTAGFAALLLRDVERVSRGVLAGLVLSVVGALFVTLGPAVWP